MSFLADLSEGGNKVCSLDAPTGRQDCNLYSKTDRTSKSRLFTRNSLHFKHRHKIFHSVGHNDQLSLLLLNRQMNELSLFRERSLTRLTISFLSNDNRWTRIRIIPPPGIAVIWMRVIVFFFRPRGPKMDLFDLYNGISIFDLIHR